MAIAPSQTFIAALLRAGSPTRTRGVQRRGASRPSGSTTRGWISPSSGSVANCAAMRGQGVDMGQRRVVIEEEQQVARHQRHAGIAAGRNAEVLRQSVRLDPVGQSGRLPPVADDHDVQVDITLSQQRAQAAVEVSRAVAHGQHHDAVAAAARRSSQPRRTEHRGQVTDDGDAGRDHQPGQQHLGRHRRR